MSFILWKHVFATKKSIFILLIYFVSKQPIYDFPEAQIYKQKNLDHTLHVNKLITDCMQYFF